MGSNDTGSRQSSQEHSEGTDGSKESGRRIESGQDYFEHAGRDVYTGPVTIHQHSNGQQEGSPQQATVPERKPGPDPRDRRPSMPPTKIIPSLKRFFLVLASQVPVLGVAVTWWTGILKQPLVAASLAVGYELLALFWKELGKPAWDEVWTQELKPEVISALKEWVSVSIRNLCSNFRRRYTQYLINEHRIFPMRGLIGAGKAALEFEQVFVELDIAPSHPYQVSTNPIAVKNLSGKQTVWTFLRRLKKQEAIGFAILGPPGCGKTTLLRHLALIFAARRHWRYRVRGYTPIILFLRDHAHAITTDPSLSLAQLAQQNFADPKQYETLKPPPYWFARHLNAGRCLLLLDGLDEVEEHQRQTIATWVDRQITKYPRCRFILTARPQGYRESHLERAHVLEIAHFSDAQVKQFVHNWYLANKVSLHGKKDQAVIQEAQRDTRNLLDRLQDKPHLKELTVNPLLLTMIVSVHNIRYKLPDRRVNLYAEICEVFLGHWQEAKGLTDDLDAKQKQVFLQPLAAAMMEQETLVMTTQDTQSIIVPYLQQIGLSEPEITKVLKNLTQITSSLLVEQEAGLWGFAHKTFQEYLCAIYWKEAGIVADWNTADWQQYIVKGWWHETLRLYAAQADASTLVEACLSLKTDAAIQLAGDIEKEALTLVPSTREDIMKALAGRVAIHLRSEPLMVSEKEFKKVFGLDEELRPLEYIQNDFDDQGEVVVDRATGLIWQKSDSGEELTYTQAEEYVKKLNSQKFAGHENWRLPTISELMSLLEPEKQENGLYMSPIFGVQEEYYWCWSADRLPEGEGGSSGAAWLVYFDDGLVDWDLLYDDDYVRCVCS